MDIGVSELYKLLPEYEEEIEVEEKSNTHGTGYRGISLWLYRNCKVPKNTKESEGIHSIIISYGLTINRKKKSKIIKEITNNFRPFKKWAKENYKL